VLLGRQGATTELRRCGCRVVGKWSTVSSPTTTGSAASIAGHPSVNTCIIVLRSCTHAGVVPPVAGHGRLLSALTAPSPLPSGTTAPRCVPEGGTAAWWPRACLSRHAHAWRKCQECGKFAGACASLLPPCPWRPPLWHRWPQAAASVSFSLWGAPSSWSAPKIWCTPYAAMPSPPPTQRHYGVAGCALQGRGGGTRDERQCCYPGGSGYHPETLTHRGHGSLGTRRTRVDRRREDEGGVVGGG
jgi:hypothetical protein